MIQIDIQPGNHRIIYHPWGVVGNPKATLKEYRTRSGGNLQKTTGKP